MLCVNSSFLSFFFLSLSLVNMTSINAELTSQWCLITGRTGLLLPCVLFGQNVENLREDIPSSQACMCHAIFVEGGIALATATVLCNGFDPRTSFLIGEGLLFSWWMCGIYTGLFRQSLQKKYHLKVMPLLLFAIASYQHIYISTTSQKAYNTCPTSL